MGKDKLKARENQKGGKEFIGGVWAREIKKCKSAQSLLIENLHQ